jgi:phosphate uptake regulator
MSSAETRKVQLTGGATYIISLPKQWAQGAGLRPGSELQLLPQDQYSLLLYTSTSPEAAPLSESRLVVAPETPTEDIVRDFITQYLAGFDIIHVDLEHIRVDQRVPLKEAIRHLLIGIEVVTETAREITVQCFLGQANLPLLSALERMGSLVRSLQKDAVTALLEGDHRLAEEVVQRDAEVDRFYFYIIRQLTSAIGRSDRIQKIGLSSPRACLSYRLAVKSIERAGDHATRIADIARVTTPVPKSNVANSLLKMHNLADSVFKDALQALHTLDVPLAHGTIRRIPEVRHLEERSIRELLGGEYPVETVLNLRLALESFRRISEYGSDIAETSLNLSVER